MIAAAVLIAAMLGQPEPAQTTSADAATDCAATRWGVCGSVFDEVAEAEDDANGQDGTAPPLVYMSAPAASDHGTADEPSEDRSGCERTEFESRDPVTGALGRSIQVSCDGGSDDPRTREELERLRRDLTSNH